MTMDLKKAISYNLNISIIICVRENPTYKIAGGT